MPHTAWRHHIRGDTITCIDTPHAVRQRSQSAVLLGLGAFATPLAAAAEDDPQAPLEEMTEFSPEDFVAEAAELPLDLVEALDSDVDLTPEEFLAQGARGRPGRRSC